ncbi:hemicentin-1-like [Mercenaria mercenaria]|uniref:hemicentin-1-like n=1 Tax=Mercenaria mercenaria TaxID=6596 RepID=UPI00234E88DD|nr:hemicentin-1-like [Mercenaria mercenaria]
MQEDGTLLEKVVPNTIRFLVVETHQTFQVNTLTLEHKGRVITGEEIVNVKENSVVTAECTPSSGRPPPDIEWFRYSNGSTLSDKILIGKVRASSIAVLRYNTSRDDNGVSIGCVASNRRNFKVTSKTISLNILYPPDIDEMKNDSAVEGSAFRILCPLLPGNPTSQTLQWKSEINYTMATTAVLSISNVSRNNNMMFICILTYKMKPTGSDTEEVGEVSKHFYLTVFYRTVISNFTTNDLQTGTVVVNYYDTVQLTCVVDSNPDSNISILFNETILEQIAKSKRLTFNMKKADCSNAGVYTCFGGNEYNYGNMARANLTVFVKCEYNCFNTSLQNMYVSPHVFV